MVENDVVVQYAFTKEEEDAILSVEPNEELLHTLWDIESDRLDKIIGEHKYKIGKLYDILLDYHEKYKFFIEVIENTIAHFILMEEKRKPVTEIELYGHCKYGEESSKFILRHCRKIGCADCNYSDKEMLEKFLQLKKNIDNFGYYTDVRQSLVSFRYSL